MKIVKHTSFGSNTTSIDGVIYEITQEGIQVSDEVASKMKEMFLDRVEVMDFVENESSADPVQTE